MRTGIKLMYVEGEIRDGYITGRTVLSLRLIAKLIPPPPITLPAKLHASRS